MKQASILRILPATPISADASRKARNVSAAKARNGVIHKIEHPFSPCDSASAPKYAAHVFPYPFGA